MNTILEINLIDPYLFIHSYYFLRFSWISVWIFS